MKTRGFTLVELMVVLTVIALLLSIEWFLRKRSDLL